MTYEQIKFTIEQIRKFENQKKETNQEKMYILDKTIQYGKKILQPLYVRKL